MVNWIVQKQLESLSKYRHSVDGKDSDSIPESFNHIVFYKQSKEVAKVKVIFADYIVKPYDGFDFHERWNNGTPPMQKTMIGEIDSQTQGMLHFNVKTEDGLQSWTGWCPKKSCTVVNM